MKKYLAILLTAALLLCAAPLAGFAAVAKVSVIGVKDTSHYCGVVDEENGLDGSQVTWELSDDNELTISGNGMMRDSFYDSISEWKTVKKIVITSGVKSIGNYAFSDCSELEHVVIPDSVTSIGNHAFSSCISLKEVAIPEYVTQIAEATFNRCTSLSDVTIGSHVTDIGRWAFGECSHLTSIRIPKSVTSISGQAFDGCTGLAELTVENNNPVYCSNGDCIIEKASKTVILGCKNSVIPTDGSVSEIGHSAFYKCIGLTNIIIPDNVTNIGASAFSECTGLKNMSIPDSVKSIGGSAFYHCTNLIEIELPDGMNSIGIAAFSGCTNLKNLVIPDGISEMADYLFSECANLASLTIPSDLKKIGDLSFGGCKALNSIVIPDNVTRIGWAAFMDSGLASIFIPQSVTEIDEDAIPEYTVIYGYNGSYAQQWAEENNRVFVLFGDASVSLNIPDVVNESTVDVYGFANPGAEVICSVNGDEAVTVKAAASGRWNAEIPLTDAKDGDSFSIKATVTVEGKTAEQTATVTYRPDAVVMQAFTLNHSCYSVTLEGARLGVAVPNITYIPGKPLAFKIKVSNNERIDKLFVVSTKDGASKQMALTYDADSGYWFANGFFDEADKNDVPGVFTIKGTDKDGKEFDAGVTIKINFLIDPSGYAYEAVPSNKLEGVTAAVYYQDQDGHELLWNAETADQLNPVTTLADGAFAWVVPEGKWQVRLTKEGYMEARSAWMDVPPEYTDVYIAMTAEAAPAVESVNVYADRAEIVFTQYMDVNTVNTENVTFAGYAGTLKPLDAEELGEGSGIWYAKTFSFTPEKAFSGEISVKIENAANYVGKALAEPYTAALAVASEPKNLTAAQETTVKYGETAEITVSAENAAGKRVFVACDSANISLSAKPLTLDETGKAALTVTGLMPGVAELTFTLEGTTLRTAAKVAVKVDGVPAEPTPHDGPAEPATPTDATFTPGDVNNDGKVGSDDARLALRASVKLEPTITEGTAAYKAADYNGDGVVKSEDARAILRVSVKLDPFA